MNLIVEVNDSGALYLPAEILAALKPNARFMVEVKNETLILHPETSDLPFWSTATPGERAERLMQWVESHKEGANLPEDALRRENIYD